jgi:hypothetical protein
MRIYQLLHELVSRFAPMDETTKTELQASGLQYYEKAKVELANMETEISIQEAINKEQALKDEPVYVPVPIMPFKLKAIKMLENPLARYLMSIMYIILVPKIKDFMNGKSKEEDEDDEPNEFEEYKDFMRFKQTMR